MFWILLTTGTLILFFPNYALMAVFAHIFYIIRSNIVIYIMESTILFIQKSGSDFTCFNFPFNSSIDFSG